MNYTCIIITALLLCVLLVENRLFRLVVNFLYIYFIKIYKGNYYNFAILYSKSIFYMKKRILRGLCNVRINFLLPFFSLEIRVLA